MEAANASALLLEAHDALVIADWPSVRDHEDVTEVQGRVSMPEPMRIYSDKLLGYDRNNCTVPHCRASTEPSTGWIEESSRDPARCWRMEFECPLHGVALAGGGQWQVLIDSVLRDHGIDPS